MVIPVDSVNQFVKEKVVHLKDLHHHLTLKLSLPKNDTRIWPTNGERSNMVLMLVIWIWLLHRHITTIQPRSKLNYMKLGPFQIIDQIKQVAFWVELKFMMGSTPPS